MTNVRHSLCVSGDSHGLQRSRDGKGETRLSSGSFHSNNKLLKTSSEIKIKRQPSDSNKIFLQLALKYDVNPFLSRLLGQTET